MIRGQRGQAETLWLLSAMTLSMSTEIKPTLATLEQAADEVEREFNVRTRCFPRWIEDGRLSRTDAQDRLDRQFTALRFLRLEIDKQHKQNMLREALHEAPIVPERVTSSGDLTLASK